MTGNKQRGILINHACSDTLFSGGNYGDENQTCLIKERSLFKVKCKVEAFPSLAYLEAVTVM